ncbi:TPA: GGDEF domain-containing protein [Stenotrophomonas maltophilia]|jgi:diguanylate cyclase (GGDEF)-like protein|uniref:GGDEF domain-containing protein n=1 Tax=Stenotrophomonas TaxID=40323 RepID=UPI000C1460A2|nr:MULTISPECIES: GGDEF domain-containing protein [Stenotrophomonas]ELF4109507.1 GGDEF domain-containing protein [Stenotrophomonas maltophilia]MBO1742012.1 GGDEF domain-containing protein [Stenotrophomonas maltophilia]MCI1148628.1 GGDEF domain-containing protein [Stenotrophomonas maltophilia]MCU1173944.1 GGDEF domain-containing protein [Stenotrophomonas maltophilia]WAP00440.1 GGDEF domain-containing protein [Stenotrophomonas sp. SBJS02]
MTLRAALFFLVVHALVIALIGPQDPVGSYLLLISAPLLAALACLRRARCSQAACQWRTLGAAVALFALALLALLYRNVAGLSPAQMTASSLILYVFYRIPLIYVAASPGGGNRYIRAVDFGIIALLWLLYYMHARAMAPLNTALWTQCLNTMSNVQNSLVFCFALIRFLAEDNADRRDFFRTLTIYALGYFLLAFYINTYQPQAPDGNWQDLLISGLFVLLAIMAGSNRRRPAAPVSPNLRRIVDAGVPLMLPLLLMMVALLVARLQPTLATIGFIGALLGYALRSVLSQAEIQRQRDELETLARRDPLTGLGNRRSFDESLGAAHRRARRQGLGLAVLMIDIDHFKRLNDTYGHPEGDRRLRAVAAILDGCLQRGDDLLARYGGEEFIAALPSSDTSHALDLGERLRAAVEYAALPAPDGHVTISVGVAWQSASDEREPDDLVDRADQALYRAKHAGRNCVQLAPAKAAGVATAGRRA